MKTCAKHIIGIVLLMSAALSLMAYQSWPAAARMPAARENPPEETPSKAESAALAVIQTPAQQPGLKGRQGAGCIWRRCAQENRMICWLRLLKARSMGKII